MSAATWGALTHLGGILARPYNVGFQTFSSETYLPDRSGCSSSEQRLCILQILGVKAFSEPAVNQSKELIRIPAFVLVLPQAAEIGRGAEHDEARLLCMRELHRAPRMGFDDAVRPPGSVSARTGASRPARIMAERPCA
jgi:hypothetical protein